MRIEIGQSKSDVVMSQRKYVLDILEEIGMLDCKLLDTSMDPIENNMIFSNLSPSFFVHFYPSFLYFICFLFVFS